MKIIKDEYGYIFKDEDVSDAADATAFAVAHIKKPLTNYDRIRAMTDEALAEWLDDICKSAYDEGYTKETGETLMSPYPSTASEWITWLKQEAGE